MSYIPIDRGSWRKEPDGIHIHCPECGTWPVLRAHTIADDGTVSPSIWHQCGTSGGNDSGQDWHVFGVLEGWGTPTAVAESNKEAQP